MAMILSININLQSLHTVQLVPWVSLMLFILSISPAPIVLDRISWGLATINGSWGCLGGVGWIDNFMSFTCSTSSFPIVLDLTSAGLGLCLEDLNENRVKVFFNKPAPGDIGLRMPKFGVISVGRLSWDISEATVTSFSCSCGSLSVLQQLAQI